MIKTIGISVLVSLNCIWRSAFKLISPLFFRQNSKKGVHYALFKFFRMLFENALKEFSMNWSFIAFLIGDKNSQDICRKKERRKEILKRSKVDSVSQDRWDPRGVKSKWGNSPLSQKEGGLFEDLLLRKSNHALNWTRTPGSVWPGFVTWLWRILEAITLGLIPEQYLRLLLILFITQVEGFCFPLTKVFSTLQTQIY